MGTTSRIRIPLFQKYDVTVTTDPVFGLFGPDQVGVGHAKTTGSSANVVAATAGTSPFGGLQVGAELSVNRDGTRDVVYISTWTDADTIVVETAVNWENGPSAADVGTGRQFHFRRFLSGQADTDGWFNRREFDDLVIQYSVPTFNATSVKLYVEGRIKGPQTVPVSLLDPIVLSAAGEGFIRVPEGVDEVRFGALVVTDGGVNTLNAYALGTPRNP